MASLTGQLVAETYKALLKLIDNDILTASEKQITDGLGGGSNVFIDSQGFLRANKYKVTNGLATQFLKADGSLDSNAYLTSITGAQVITALGYTPVPTTRTITINGETHNLAADNSWTVGGTAAIWGNITGTLSNQTDLQNALNAKYNNPAGTISQYIRGDGTLATFPTMPGGLPTGGSAGQILAKIDATDYNTHWIDNYATQTKNEVKLGQTLTKGTPVYVSSANGTNMIVSAASNTSEALSSKTFGLLETGGATNDLVKCVTFGLLAGLDTSTASAGDPVWLGPNGTLIFGLVNKPYAPAHLVYIGVVTRVQQNNGEIFVNVQNGFELKEIHDVYIADPANNHGLFYDISDGLWKNKSIATALGYTPQAQLSGTGFVKASGTTITYDNSTYLTTADAASTYQRLDKMVSNLLASDTEYPNSNAVIAALALKADAANPVFTGNMTISGAEPKLYFTDTDQNPDYFIGVDAGFFRVYDQTAGATRFVINSDGNISTGVGKSITAGSFIKDGGTATQFLKADGSVDSTDYATVASLANYLLSATAASTYQTLANLSTDLTTSATKYPSVNAVNAGLATKQPLDADLTAIAALTGTTGFLKKTAADTWTLDTSTYLTTGDASTTYLAITTAASTYQRLDKMVSNLLPSSTEYPNSQAVINALALKADAANPVFTGNMTISGAEPKLYFVDTDQNPDYTVFIDSGFFYIYDQTAGATRFSINSSGNINTGVGKSITAGSFIKESGTASQFLKADGSIDSNAYVTGGPYLALTGGTLSGQLTFSSQGSKITFGDSTSTSPMMIGEGLVDTFGVDSDFMTMYFRNSFRLFSQLQEVARFTNTGLRVYGSIVKDGGTSSQFLKADGSIDSNTYATTSSLGNYLPLAGGTMTGVLTGSGSGTFYIYNYGRIGLPNAGRIIYNNGTGSNMFFGEIQQDVYGFTGNLYSDIPTLAMNVSSKRVGIGFASPNAPLDILSQTTDSSNVVRYSYNGTPTGYYLNMGTIVTAGLVKWTYDQVNNGTTYSNVMTFDRGKIGINNTSPAQTLDVGGAIKANRLGFLFPSFTGNKQWEFASDPNLGDGAYIYANGTGYAQSWFPSGNIGIGTTTDSGYKLDVQGTGIFRGNLLVTTTSGSGFTITTNDVATLRMINSGGGTKNWGFATTNLAASDFGIYQSNAGGGDPINAGTPKLYFAGSGNIGINTTTDAGYKLDVQGTTSRFFNNGSSTLIVHGYNSPYLSTLKLAFDISAYGANFTYNADPETLTIENYGRSVASTNQGGIFFRTKLNNTTPTNVLSINGFNGYATFISYLYASRFIIQPNGTNQVYNIVNASNTYAGSYTIQAGEGSSGFGGSFTMWGHSHASRAGFVSAGISSGSNGKFTVMNAAIGAGSDVFTVDVSGNVLASGIITASAGINFISTVRMRWGGNNTPALGFPFGGSDTGNSLFIEAADGDTGGIAINNDGVTVYGAADTGFVFRAIDEDSYQSGVGLAAATTFQVNQGTSGGGSIKGDFTMTGSAYANAFYESSDFRLKTLIEHNPILDGIENLQAKLYTKNGKTELGYFAQDAEKLMPYAVEKGADGFLSLSYREVHTAKIARLEQRVAELEKQLNIN